MLEVRSYLSCLNHETYFALHAHVCAYGLPAALSTRAKEWYLSYNELVKETSHYSSNPFPDEGVIEEFPTRIEQLQDIVDKLGVSQNT